jgi:hypothetical protein
VTLTNDALLMNVHAVAAALAAARLLALRIAKRQRAIFCLLILTALADLFLAVSPIGSREYFWRYLAVQPLSLIADTAVVLELFHFTMAAYPGVETAARRVLRGVIAISALGSVALTAASWDTRTNPSHVYYLLVINHAVQFGLALTVIALLLFLSRYPIRLPRNTYVSCYFFSAVFLVEAADSLLAALSPLLFSRLVDMAAVLILSGLLLVWTSMLRHQSEDSVISGVHFGDNDAGALLLQLESLNRTLSRVSRQE